MTIEARELYWFTTSTEPFASKAKEVAKDLMKLKGLVADAAGTYNVWYGTKGFPCFSKADMETVVTELFNS